MTVDADKRNSAGKVVGTETIGAQRNEWEVKPAGVVILRTLSIEEKTKIDRVAHPEKNAR